MATKGTGIVEVAEQIAAHTQFLRAGGMLGEKRVERAVERIREIVSERMRVEFWDEERERTLDAEVRRMLSGETTPYDIAERLLAKINRM